MNFDDKKPICIEDIIQALINKNRDYILFLKNKFYRFRPSLFYKIYHIQAKKSRILKKHTKGLLEINGLTITIYTSEVFIYFNYAYSQELYDIQYKYARGNNLRKIL